MADQLTGIGRPKTVREPQREQAQQGKIKTAAGQQATKREDRVSLSQPAKTETYGPIPGVDIGTPYELLRSLVIKTLKDQGAATQIDTGSEILNLNELSPEEAQELVSDEGYFGVEKTSDRIVDFAINAFGNDPSRLEEMKAAIDDGFKQAADVFGGSLPGISHETYAAIMDKLDTFASKEQDSE